MSKTCSGDLGCTIRVVSPEPFFQFWYNRTLLFQSQDSGTGLRDCSGFRWCFQVHMTRVTLLVCNVQLICALSVVFSWRKTFENVRCTAKWLHFLTTIVTVLFYSSAFYCYTWKESKFSCTWRNRKYYSMICPNGVTSHLKKEGTTQNGMKQNPRFCNIVTVHLSNCMMMKMQPEKT